MFVYDDDDESVNEYLVGYWDIADLIELFAIVCLFVLDQFKGIALRQGIFVRQNIF